MNYLSIDNNFLGIEEKYSSFNDSKIVVNSVPLEETVSYGKGTSMGPSSILEASHFVEFYDEEFDREICFETGICTLAPMNFENLDHKQALDLIEQSTDNLIKQNKFVVTLGGEHSLSSAPIKAHLKHYNNLSVLQIDAHSDLRDSYEGSKLSHASVMKRVFEQTPNIVQVGIRAQCKEEADLIKKNNITTFYARDIRSLKHGEDWKEKVWDSRE